MTMYTLHTPPPPVGYWELPGSTPQFGTRFSAIKKPNWFHRTMMRVLLGWTWRDFK